MLRSLFSGISGLRANQTMLDVTGNNIANANTVGFKGSSVLFQESLSQNVRGAGTPQIDQGGTNPTQIGLGTAVSAITTNMGQGAAQNTGRPTDVMLQGDGMFVVRRGQDTFYTRVGQFNFDAGGRLVTANGCLVQGFAVDPFTGEPDIDGGLVDITIDENAIFPPLEDGVALTSYQITNTGQVVGYLSDGTEYAFGQLAVADFANPVGLTHVGETMFQPTGNSGAPQLGVSGLDGNGSILTGALEMSNVDLAAEFTNLILAQRGFQASSRVITTSDSILEELVNLKRG